MTPLDELINAHLPRRVRHVMLGFEGTAVRAHTPEGLSSWPGLMVVWDQDVEIVGVEPGEEVWYPVAVLTRLDESVPQRSGWWRRTLDWLDRFAELRRSL